MFNCILRYQSISVSGWCTNSWTMDNSDWKMVSLQRNHFERWEVGFLFSCPQPCRHTDYVPSDLVVKVGGCSIKPATSLRSLVVTLDSLLSFDCHITEVSRSCHYIWGRSAISGTVYHTRGHALLLDPVLVLSRLDYFKKKTFNTFFVSNHRYPENPEVTQVIVGSLNMGYISDTARNQLLQLLDSWRR